MGRPKSNERAEYESRWRSLIDGGLHVVQIVRGRKTYTIKTGETYTLRPSSKGQQYWTPVSLARDPDGQFVAFASEGDGAPLITAENLVKRYSVPFTWRTETLEDFIERRAGPLSDFIKKVNSLKDFKHTADQQQKDAAARALSKAAGKVTRARIDDMFEMEKRVAILESEVSHLRSLMDQLFGEDPLEAPKVRT